MLSPHRSPDVAAPSATAASVALHLGARVTLAHACVQALAEARGIDLLHVKGPALDPTLRSPHRTSSDADVLVRPDHVATLVIALLESGWRRVTDFRSGSVFEHAANYHHDDWGYVDVHRSFPGVTLAPSAAFESLWRERHDTRLAHRPCAVPSVHDQALLLCLHAAREFDHPRARTDVHLAWHQASPEAQDRIRGRASALGAEVALAAAIGELERHDDRGDRSVALWRYYSRGGSRLDEWRARFRAAPTWRSRAALGVRLLQLNRDYVAMALGHEPTRGELARFYLGRVTTARRLLVGAVRRAGGGVR